jgi:hypothetical protein
MSLTFDPNFASNGHLYVYYVSAQGGTHNRVSRLTAQGDTMVPGSERVGDGAAQPVHDRSLAANRPAHDQ